MSQQPSGWYDDPSSPEMLRYWDGVTWTSHTTPKKSPTASQSTIGLSQQQPTSPMPQGSGWATSGPAVGEQQGQPGAQGPQVPMPPQQGYGQQGYGQPMYPSATQAAWMATGPTTADGVPLASWGKRFAAWLIDGVILFALWIACFVLFFPGLMDTFSHVMEVAATGDPDATNVAMEAWSEAVVAKALPIGLLQVGLTLVYCLAFWTTTAQTIGKMVVGISVRRADRPGPLDVVTALRRRLLSFMQIIPVLSALWFVLWPLDGLFPLWDAKRQAIHDKIADTVVVVGKQPRTKR